MGHRQRHRGQHSNDAKLFSKKWLPKLNRAVDDLSYLLSRGYSRKSSIQLVGDRFRLTDRQRKALWRASCTDANLLYRQNHEWISENMSGQSVAIDGYNLLITVESGLAGGIVIECRDGCYRDIASVHGTYRKVEETMPALELIGQTLQALQIKEAKWYLDAPVSNSGRLKGIMEELAEVHQFPWTIHLVNNPDKEIVQMQDLITVSSDGWVLSNSMGWFNLHRYIVSRIGEAHIIELTGEYTVDER